MNEQRSRRGMEEMRPHLEAWEASGQSKKSFCKDRGIALSVFYYWHNKYKEKSKPGGFVPISIGNTPSQTGIVEVKYPNGVTLRLPSGTSVLAIKQYIYL